MKQIFFTILLMFSSMLYAQQTVNKKSLLELNNIDIEIRAGVNIGGMSPLPLPVEIREIQKYSPEFNGVLGSQITKWITEKVGVSSGLRFENKGMETSARVKSYKTSIVEYGDEIKGYWTGSVLTIVKISYLTIPVLINYELNKQWRFQFGGYFSYNMTGKFSGKVYNGYLREESPVGNKIEFNGDKYATFDFSDKLNKTYWGIQISEQWRALNHLYITSQFMWGINGVFQQDFKTISFKMYPIYISLGASYLFELHNT